MADEQCLSRPEAQSTRNPKLVSKLVLNHVSVARRLNLLEIVSLSTLYKICPIVFSQIRRNIRLYINMLQHFPKKVRKWSIWNSNFSGFSKYILFNELISIDLRHSKSSQMIFELSKNCHLRKKGGTVEKMAPHYQCVTTSKKPFFRKNFRWWPKTDHLRKFSGFFCKPKNGKKWVKSL